jgi:hypothetical protein
MMLCTSFSHTWHFGHVHRLGHLGHSVMFGFNSVLRSSGKTLGMTLLPDQGPEVTWRMSEPGHPISDDAQSLSSTCGKFEKEIPTNIQTYSIFGGSRVSRRTLSSSEIVVRNNNQMTRMSTSTNHKPAKSCHKY